MDLEKMQELILSFKRTPVLEVGVFGPKNARKEMGKSGPSNADLACAHEYGVPQHNLPARSILVTPLHDHAKEIMEKFKGHDEWWFDKKGLEALWKKVGIACEIVISQAFDTGGFGKWAPLKAETIWRKLTGSLKKRKGEFAQIYVGQASSAILIDNGELRNAFSSRVRFKF